ncbi:unnamed protein product [Arabis nemorensis]|uniref:Cystatin domain-containing protein n=1 Tax=Arabis nemorensis TaxID=586526 RepID=A0A565CUG4_9BRAS|nr:unnamed protein product [Arabis nemorensis]
MGSVREWYMRPFPGRNCPLVVNLYAKLGLHRHNMLEGTKLQLLGIEKYNRRGMNMPASYFITSRAYDHATTSLVAFQTQVDEEEYNTKNVTCHIARHKKTVFYITYYHYMGKGKVCKRFCLVDSGVRGNSACG